MKGFDNLNEEVAKDLIEFINSVTGFEKSKSVNYPTKNGVIRFNYVTLNDILSKIKENNNFALMQPIGTDEHGQTGVKCVLIHKSGHVFESDTYPFHTAEGSKLQDEGTEITYRKRYALSSFLGMATEEDNDGNDMQSINSNDRKAPPKQIDILLQYYSGDSLWKMLKENNIKKIEDLSLKRASDLIKVIMSKGATND